MTGKKVVLTRRWRMWNRRQRTVAVLRDAVLRLRSFIGFSDRNVLDGSTIPVQRRLRKVQYDGHRRGGKKLG